jgi:hypothetical protein
MKSIPLLIIPFAVYNFFVFTGMDFIDKKFFDLSSTHAMSGGGLIVLGAVVLLCMDMHHCVHCVGDGVDEMTGRKTPKKASFKVKDMKKINFLAVKLASIRAQVEAAGGFLHDRELHQCPACGLMEDVLFSGKLVTYWGQSTEPVDTGLRFKEVGADQLACPCCGCVSLVLDADIE